MVTGHGGVRTLPYSFVLLFAFQEVAPYKLQSTIYLLMEVSNSASISEHQASGMVTTEPEYLANPPVKTHREQNQGTA